MARPVPARIIREISDAIAKFADVGGVLEQDPAMGQAGRDQDWTQKVKQAIAGGKYAVEITAGPIVPQQQVGAPKYNRIDLYEMDVIITAHLPDPLPFIDEAHPDQGTITPGASAMGFLAEVYALASTVGPDDPGSPPGAQTQCGVWFEFAGSDTQGPALATWTDVVGGGAAVIGELGTRETGVGLTVYFRVRRGDMGAVG